MREEKRWVTLEMCDWTIRTDSQAREAVLACSSETGNQYRAQVKCGRMWVTIYPDTSTISQVEAICLASRLI